MFNTFKTSLQALSKSIFQKAIAAECKKAGLQAAQIQLSFGQLHYLESERKDQPEAIILLHGFAADKNGWIRFAKQMGSTRRILIPDLPGHGDSCQDMALNYGIRQQALYLHAFIEVLQIKRVHLIGNSMGAAIAMRFAHDYPDAVASLILIGAAGAETTPSELRELVARAGKHPFIQVQTVADYQSMLRFGMEKPPYLPGFILRHLLREKIRRAAIELKMLSEVEPELDQSAILQKIHAACLIIWGAKDRVMHVDDAHFLQENIAGSKKIILPGLGHVPMVEDPQLVAKNCQAFLDQLSVAP